MIKIIIRRIRIRIYVTFALSNKQNFKICPLLIQELRGHEVQGALLSLPVTYFPVSPTTQKHNLM